VKRVCEDEPAYFFFLAAFFFAGFFAFFFAAIVFPPRNIAPFDHETTRTNIVSARLARRDRARQGSDGRNFAVAPPDPGAPGWIFSPELGSPVGRRHRA
jgi:hypothetical protein